MDDLLTQAFIAGFEKEAGVKPTFTEDEPNDETGNESDDEPTKEADSDGQMELPLNVS